jgi:hypothetical protein
VLSGSTEPPAGEHYRRTEPGEHVQARDGGQVEETPCAR